MQQYGFVEFKAATDADRCLNELVARERQQKQTDGGSKKQALGAKASAGPSNTVRAVSALVAPRQDFAFCDSAVLVGVHNRWRRLAGGGQLPR